MSIPLARLALKEKKPKKKEAQAIIKMLADRYPESDTDLAVLYSFFMPTKSKVVKTDFDWISQAMGKKDVRYYLNYVYVTDTKIIATDRYRVHICLNKDKLKPGYYLHNGDFYDEPSYAKYPDIEIVIPKLDMYSFTTDQLPALVTEHKNTVCYKLLYGLDILGEFAYIPKDKLDQAINGQSEIQLGVTKDKIKIEYDDRLAVIMGIRH